ncbi:MAG TPA: PilT/PilU family type 4a pilus ATPase [Vicinamibacteria bacterium]|nr:PilT/PilU family type 4a pilus ATPase [Vicinamibacteria bacterium]
MARLDSFLRIVSDQRASDLHLHAGNVPVIRHDGELINLPFRVLSALETERFLHEILSAEQRAQLEAERQLDLMYVIPELGRFRANLFRKNGGLGAVFRIIPDHRPTLDEIGMPPVVKRLSDLGNGLVIVTGPTGSGKTTTLAAMVHEINLRSERHIITIEDPIEFVHEPVKSAITQREVGRHTESFAAGLRSALREAPDVLVIGEMRDQETVQLALSAAETGVLVLGTLHTNSAAKAIDRIIDAVPAEVREQTRGGLSVLLRAVIAQHLLRRASGDGRVVAPEILLVSHAVANLIRENKVHQIEAYLQTASDGSQSLDACLLRLVAEGRVTVAEALTVADYPDQLKRQVASLPEDA